MNSRNMGIGERFPMHIKLFTSVADIGMCVCMPVQLQLNRLLGWNLHGKIVAVGESDVA